ncbi:V4R domain-containing protein [Methanobrevibacter sp.]|uniref:V4R domain-containing protein n=1 Tax=Methanobrevibacter sp. TaxID=66852 RepID=UPI00388E3D7C
MITSNPIQIILNNNKTDQQMVGIDIIKSPIKYEILDLLRHGEMNFEEIVGNMSKSKASISMHLRDLREEGIVNYRVDPIDNRKKIFFLESEFLGSIDSEKIKEAHKNQTRTLIEEYVKKGDIEFATLLTNTLKSYLLELGIDISPILKNIGNYIGEYLFNQLADENLDLFLQNIRSYWLENNLGRLHFNTKNHIEITCIGCFESVYVPRSGEANCFIEKGIFEALFNKFFNFDLKIEETKCYSMGDGKCVFIIQP